MAEAPDLNSAHLSSQALTLDVVGKQFALTSNRQSMIGDRKFDETDLIQAAAAKELTKSGQDPNFRPQSVGPIPSNVPTT